MAPTSVFDPEPPSGARKGGLANAEVFDPEIDSFVREVLQNARDQKRKEDDTVNVRFATIDLSGTLKDEFLEAMDWQELRPHVESAADAGRHHDERTAPRKGSSKSGPIRSD